MTEPVLDLAVRHRLGAFRLDMALTSRARVTALFGPSGSGKTSLINIVAGLIRPQAGHIRIAGETLTDLEQGLVLPPHRRRVGYVFQEARLFPHLSVKGNLLFGHRFVPRRERRPAELSRVTDMLGIAHLLSRRPDALSGGEKQRVAIGRALLAQPRVLLLDEPLAALDAARKAEVLPFLERLRDAAGLPILYVSHELSEVTRLAGAVALVQDGRIAACGPPAEVFARLDLAAGPGATEPGAVLPAEVVGFDAAFGLARLATPAGELLVARDGLRLGQRLQTRIAAGDVMLALDPPGRISALNILPGIVASLGERRGEGGAMVLLALDCGDARLVARLTAKSVASLGLAAGMPVQAVVKSVSIETL